MGNCQAVDAASIMIEHPGGRVERIYWPVTANEVMVSSPGHYVAQIILSVSPKAGSGRVPQKQLKLIRPDDSLRLGNNYRLVSFEEVLMEFSGKNYVRLNKLLSLQKQRAANPERDQTPSISGYQGDQQTEEEVNTRASVTTRSMGRQGQWRPALQSISEVGR
eukprot:Gb_15293 [translate_table: standard]